MQVDDSAVSGAITELARRISDEYAMLTARRLDLFIDRDALEWGDEWRSRIDEAIAGTTFFIPIVTPRYFESDECRRELVQFTGKARGSGLEELLLPVHYVDVPDIDEDQPTDDAVRLIKQTQWVDWRALRLSDPTDSAYRQGVNAMAIRLAEISDRVAQIPDVAIKSEPSSPTHDGPEEPPGTVDLLARGEAALPTMTGAMEALADEARQIGDIMRHANAEVATSDASHGGFAARLKIARDVARKLDPHADRIEGLGREYGAALVEADPAVQTIIAGLQDEITSPDGSADAEVRSAALGYVQSVQEMAKNVRAGIATLRDFFDVLQGLADLSRDIRRPANRIKNGLQGLVDGQAVIEEWARQAAILEAIIRDTE